MRTQEAINHKKIEKQFISIISANFDDSRSAADWDTLKEIDWSAVFQSPSVIELLSLVYFTLKKYDRLDQVPAVSVARLETAYLGSVKQDLLQLHEFGSVLQALNNASIDVVVFKGAAFMETVYPQIGLRPMHDIDFLIENRSQLSTVSKTLREIGFYPLNKERNDLFIDAVIYEATFKQNNPPWTTVDIHYALPYIGFQKNQKGLRFTERVWQNACSAEIGGEHAWLMAPEDTIPTIIAHDLLQHRMERLRLYCDLGFLIKTNDVDWSKVVSNLTGSPAAPYIAHALRRARDAFKIPVPVETLDECDRLAGSTGIFRQIIADHSSLMHVNLWDSLSEAETITRKLRLLARYVFPSKNYMKQAYKATSKWRLLLLYAYRPCNIAAQSIKLVWNALVKSSRGDEQSGLL